MKIGDICWMQDLSPLSIVLMNDYLFLHCWQPTYSLFCHTFVLLLYFTYSNHNSLTMANNYLDSFERRHIGIIASEKDEMLKSIGVSSLDELINRTVPNDIRMDRDLKVPASMTEFEYLNELEQTAAKNKVYRSYIGQGYYGTITPSVLLRNIFQIYNFPLLTVFNTPCLYNSCVMEKSRKQYCFNEFRGEKNLIFCKFM